jgi:hypothetical protein
MEVPVAALNIAQRIVALSFSAALLFDLPPSAATLDIAANASAFSTPDWLYVHSMLKEINNMEHVKEYKASGSGNDVSCLWNASVATGSGSAPASAQHGNGRTYSDLPISRILHARRW